MAIPSVVWKALYNFNPIDDGPFFRGCSWIEGTKKASLPKMSSISYNDDTWCSYILPKKIQKNM